MRLGQIARKVNVKPAEIRNFIKDQFDVELDKDPNVKIEDAHAEAIIENFKIEEVIEEKAPEVKQVVEELEIDPTIETDLESLKEVVEGVVTEEEVVIPEIKAEEEEQEEVAEAAPVEQTVDLKKVEIDYESEEAPLDEGGNFEEVPVDPDAELIAAKVEKLEGLKVVGKIELEDDKITKKLMNEEVELPTADAIETEIDALDGDLDTSEFTEIGGDEAEKEAIFAELDAQMENKSDGKVKAGKVKAAAEVEANIEDEEENSIYKDEKGIYHFTSEQRKNRKESLRIKAEKERIRKQKEKKARHYKEQVASKAVQPKKKKGPSKKVQQKQAAQQAKKDAPKGLWGKFLNWINDRD